MVLQKSVNMKAVGGIEDKAPQCNNVLGYLFQPID